MKLLELTLGIGISALLVFTLFVVIATINNTTLSEEWRNWKDAFK